MYEKLKGLKIGFAMTGSFCTFKKAFEKKNIKLEKSRKSIVKKCIL